MAKSDYICGSCKKVRGSDRRGNPTEKYKCAECGDICFDCVKLEKSFFGNIKGRFCRKCKGGVLLYEFNEKRNRWEKV